MDLNTKSTDYQAGFRAGMEYQESVEIDLLVALLHIEVAAMDITCERRTIRDAARAAIAKATEEKPSAQHTDGQLLAIGSEIVLRESITAESMVIVADGATEQHARRLVACWNACEGISTEALEKLPRSFGNLLNDEHAESVEQIEWLQKVNTLHRQVDILYVVSGYEVTITWDGEPVSEIFYGQTVTEAINNAMAGFDLEARHSYQDRIIYGYERQMAALTAHITAQRDELMKALQEITEIAERVDGWESFPLGPIERARAAIAKADAA